MARTGREAITWARQHSTWAVGYCQQYVRTAFDVGSYYGTAAAAWAGAEHKHRVTHEAACPRGVPVFWTGGSHGYGHVALSIGNGLCISTDAGGAGRVAVVNIDSLTARWGLRFEGWAEDINRVRVFTPRPPKPRPFEIRFAVRVDHLIPHHKNWSIRRLQRALRRKSYKLRVTGHYNDATRAAVRSYQHRIGFRGADADGIPGTFSLHRLGLKPR